MINDKNISKNVCYILIFDKSILLFDIKFPIYLCINNKTNNQNLKNYSHEKATNNNL